MNIIKKEREKYPEFSDLSLEHLHALVTSLYNDNIKPLIKEEINCYDGSINTFGLSTATLQNDMAIKMILQFYKELQDWANGEELVSRTDPHIELADGQLTILARLGKYKEFLNNNKKGNKNVVYGFNPFI